MQIFIKNEIYKTHLVPALNGCLTAFFPLISGMVIGIMLLVCELSKKCYWSNQSGNQDCDSKVHEIQDQINEHRDKIKYHLMVIRDLKQQMDY